MRVATKWLCGLLVAVMALTGPLLSRAAVVHAAEPSPSPVDVEVSDADRVATGFLNVGYVPGKALVCGLGPVATVGLMVITLGTASRAANATFNEACGGSWTLSPVYGACQVPHK